MQLRNLYKSVSGKGDTIVEVLLCIAIVGAVIAGAYGLASHSLAEGISASEHSQAIKLAEAQVESLKSRQRDDQTKTYWQAYFAPANPISPADITAKSNFCLDTTSTRMHDSANPNNPDAQWVPQYNGNRTDGFTSNNLKATAAAQIDTYNPICTDTKNAATAKYFININILPNTDTTPSYLVTVKWLPPGNGPNSQTQIYYRF